MTDEEIAREWFTKVVPRRSDSFVACGTILLREEVLDIILAGDVGPDTAGMLVAHVDDLGRVVVDEFAFIERTKP